MHDKVSATMAGKVKKFDFSGAPSPGVSCDGSFVFLGGGGVRIEQSSERVYCPLEGVVEEGGTVTLDCEGVDPLSFRMDYDEDEASVPWEWEGLWGASTTPLDAADLSSPLFTAPSGSAGKEYHYIATMTFSASGACNFFAQALLQQHHAPGQHVRFRFERVNIHAAGPPGCIQPYFMPARRIQTVRRHSYLLPQQVVHR